MTNPIEVMAKAYWENRGNHSWDSLTETMKRHEMDDIRAALLALSECDLPEEVVMSAVLEAENSDTGSTNEHIVFAFRAMLRQLAEGK